MNPAINARDAMPDGGVLTIISERAPGGGTASADEVVLRVLDTGEGMLPEVVARAFEPFFTTEDRAWGSGLGLATVHGIVRLCGGDIALESESGVGTTITMRLPASARSVASLGPEGPRSVGGREGIMLIEDQEPLRGVTAWLLGAYGYEVVVAGTVWRPLRCSRGTAPRSSWS